MVMGSRGPKPGTGGRPPYLTPEQRKRNNWNGVLRARYNITADEWEGLFEFQGGVCAICGMNPPASGRRFHVDHDHKTGLVRGLICWSCNSYVLRRNMTADVLRKAVAYLESPPLTEFLGEPRLTSPGPVDTKARRRRRRKVRP